MGPDGLRIEAITLGDADVAYVRRRHPDAHAGQSFFLITPRGRLVAYCRDIEEVAEFVAHTDLQSPGGDADETG